MRKLTLSNEELLRYLELLLCYNEQLLREQNCCGAISDVIDELNKRMNKIE